MASGDYTKHAHSVGYGRERQTACIARGLFSPSSERIRIYYVIYYDYFFFHHVLAGRRRRLFLANVINGRPASPQNSRAYIFIKRTRVYNSSRDNSGKRFLPRAYVYISVPEARVVKGRRGRDAITATYDEEERREIRMMITTAPGTPSDRLRVVPFSERTARPNDRRTNTPPPGRTPDVPRLEIFNYRSVS